VIAAAAAAAAAVGPTSTAITGGTFAPAGVASTGRRAGATAVSGVGASAGIPGTTASASALTAGSSLALTLVAIAGKSAGQSGWIGHIFGRFLQGRVRIIAKKLHGADHHDSDARQNHGHLHDGGAVSTSGEHCCSPFNTIRGDGVGEGAFPQT
jgi:hypothetical protein